MVNNSKPDQCICVFNIDANCQTTISFKRSLQMKRNGREANSICVCWTKKSAIHMSELNQRWNTTELFFKPAPTNMLRFCRYIAFLHCTKYILSVYIYVLNQNNSTTNINININCFSWLNRITIVLFHSEYASAFL